MSAVGVTKTKLTDQRIIVYGAGTAGLGIVWQLRDAMVAIDGAKKEDANKQFWIIDKDGRRIFTFLSRPDITFGPTPRFDHQGLRRQDPARPRGLCAARRRVGGG